jgi:hypothetical protein
MGESKKKTELLDEQGINGEEKRRNMMETRRSLQREAGMSFFEEEEIKKKER